MAEMCKRKWVLPHCNSIITATERLTLIRLGVWIYKAKNLQDSMTVSIFQYIRDVSRFDVSHFIGML